MKSWSGLPAGPKNKSPEKNLQKKEGQGEKDQIRA